MVLYNPGDGVTNVKAWKETDMVKNQAILWLEGFAIHIDMAIYRYNKYVSRYDTALN